MTTYMKTDRLLAEIQSELFNLKYKHQDCLEVEGEAIEKLLVEVAQKLEIANKLYRGEENA